MAMLRKAKSFRTRHTGPDPDAYLRRIDLSNLHPSQVIPFSNYEERKRLVVKHWSTRESRFPQVLLAASAW